MGVISPVAILRDARHWRALRMRTACVALLSAAPVPLSLALRDREAVVSKGEGRAQVFQSPYAIALPSRGG
jgi:hypothetical protein